MKNQGSFLWFTNIDNGDNYLENFLIINSFFDHYVDFLSFIFANTKKLLIKKFLRNTKPIHYAVVLSQAKFQKYQNILSSNEYKERHDFQSLIIAKQLRIKYKNKKIEVRIKKIKNKQGKEIEIFLIKNGLTEQTIQKENLLLKHFAINVKQSALVNVKKELILNKFKIVGSGHNEEEKSNITYYEKIYKDANKIRLELFEKE